MKKFLYLIIGVLIFSACSNLEQEFPDFDYNSVYFPIQYPLRTIVLGHDRFDNTFDNQNIFHVGIGIGGMYENKSARTIGYTVDNSLCDGIALGVDTLEALPSNYYNILSSATEVTIPSGKFEGLIQVQLTEDFYIDSASVGRKYALPLRITDQGDIDSLLTGSANVENPDKRNQDNWSVQPKDFTIFMVNYINEYAGDYFAYGQEYDVNEDTLIVDYEEKYLHESQRREVNTLYRNSVIYKGLGVNIGGNYEMVLTIASDNSITISQSPGGRALTGTGTFYPHDHANAVDIAGITYPVMQLEYQYVDDGGRDRRVVETLVRFSRGLTFNVYTSNPSIFSTNPVNW